MDMRASRDQGYQRTIGIVPPHAYVELVLMMNLASSIETTEKSPPKQSCPSSRFIIFAYNGQVGS
jgi:hypothetical protein